MRLLRPYIPLEVRVAVAERQVRESGRSTIVFPRHSLRKQLEGLLAFLFGGDEKTELHHRPALCNRRRHVRNGKTFYDPPANDPDHLVYLLKEGEHDIETRVRGVGAQRSDLGQLRYNKRVAKNRAPKKPKRKWPSRPFPRRS